MARSPERGEIATTRDGRDITRGYVDALPYLPNTDEVFRAAGGWKAWKELLRDDQVAATFAQRRLAVVSRATEVEPASQSRADRRAAELVRATIDRLAWDTITEQMLHARLFGLAIAEVIWAPERGQLVVQDIRVRDAERFAFASDGALLLRTSRRPDGERMPDKKFWICSVGAAHHDEPYGRGLAHALWWPVWLKRQGARYWAIFLEKFGAPTALGRFPVGTDAAERDRLLQAIQAIQTDAGVILPEGMGIELLEASRAGSAGYEQWLAYWDRAIAKVVLGQTMTTEDGSSLSQARVHQDVRREIVQADADLICQSAAASWITWLVELNLPGATPPRIWRDLSEPEDLEARARRDATLASIGWKLTADAVSRVYGDDYEPVEPAEPPAAGEAPAAAPPNGADRTVDAAERAEPPPPADQIADRLAIEADPLVAAWVERLRAMVEAASSLEELRATILEAFGELDGAELTRILGQALLVAQAAGRADVLEAGDG